MPIGVHFPTEDFPEAEYAVPNVTIKVHEVLDWDVPITVIDPQSVHVVGIALIYEFSTTLIGGET
jgi:hypothetical protein